MTNDTKCDVCDKEYRSTVGLQLHKKSVHIGITNKCETCGAQFNQKINLSTHIKSIHQGVRFPCGLCSFKATRKGNLSAHKKNVHQADHQTKLQCTFCDFQTMYNSALTRHIKMQHSKI